MLVLTMMTSCLTQPKAETVIYQAPGSSSVEAYFAGEWAVTSHASREGFLERRADGLMKISISGASMKEDGGAWRPDFAVVATRQRFAFGPFSGFPIIVDQGHFYVALQDFSDGAPKEAEGLFGILLFERR